MNKGTGLNRRNSAARRFMLLPMICYQSLTLTGFQQVNNRFLKSGWKLSKILMGPFLFRGQPLMR
jgi:hypothetical protein